MKKNFFNNKYILFATLILSLIPLATIFSKIWLGEFAFWYDPARDLLSALDNLSKLTLIGPTTGIPGVFYGPYWIWLLSLGEIFSPNPRIVTIIAVTIPYVLIFPFILSRFSKVIGLPVIAMMWLLFLLGFNNYFTDLWNPHLAPLLILLTIYLLFNMTNKLSIKNLITTMSSGFAAGLVMNFQLSFGIGMFLGLTAYLIGESIFYFINTKNKSSLIMKRLIIIAVFFCGCIVSFAPFLIFEIRHQFFQTKILLNALMHYGGVVALTGLTKIEIFQNFFGIIASLLQIPLIPALSIFILTICVYAYSYKKRHSEEKTKEIKLLCIIVSIILGILYVYLTAKNPIWKYHFIGVEVLFLLLIGLFINKLKKAQVILVIWIVILILISSTSFFSKINKEHKMIFGTLIAKQKVVEKVKNESRNKDYVVFAYNPSIYIYDYSYIFRWMYGKDVPYRPELNPKNADLVFLIIPPDIDQSKIEDFINFRTPTVTYITNGQWILDDKTKILKREKQTR